MKEIMKGKPYIEKDLDSYFDFDNTSGKLSAVAYSYEINSFGEIELTEEETKLLFLSMYNFYKATDHEFYKAFNK
jgi:hypothetical protein